MLDREVILEFLEEELQDEGIKIPKGIKMEELTEAFCQYMENDYYEWLKDNYRSFFSNDWDWISEKIKETKREGQ